MLELEIEWSVAIFVKSERNNLKTLSTLNFSGIDLSDDFNT